ncbi:TetR/AcrR family transcriptional regulator [Soonwooa sp.]|uniref:TetR/AcrR family transcriptional regulator n=1 Tax=Soonwooa sp. TaxID=1938592 RepID=UPI00260374DF|nr:TetR/AcrR family transcriptional regulator [Soonwooa sp.]
MEISKEENILFAAEKLFAKNGFGGTSTREICKEANVNISMISYYFGSKEKLYERIFEYRMNESISFGKDILAQTNLNEWEKICLLIDQFSGRVIRLRGFYCIMQREQLTNKTPYILDFLKTSKMSFLKFYKELITSGYNNKLFTKKPKVEFVHSTIAGTMFSGINGVQMYKEFFGAQDDANFESVFFADLKEHLKNVLKYLLGYNEKQTN